MLRQWLGGKVHEPCPFQNVGNTFMCSSYCCPNTRLPVPINICPLCFSPFSRGTEGEQFFLALHRLYCLYDFQFCQSSCFLLLFKTAAATFIFSLEGTSLHLTQLCTQNYILFVTLPRHSRHIRMRFHIHVAYPPHPFPLPHRDRCRDHVLHCCSQ